MSITRNHVQLTGLLAGPILAMATYLLLPVEYVLPDGSSQELTHAARATTAIAVWMAIWWLTEAIEIYATALLPIVLLPLTGASDLKQATFPYAHYLIFLFLGGFILSLAMERWGLHRRIALSVLRLFGSRPSTMVAGFMTVTAGLSMWVSNTATTIMMLPIALSVLKQVSTVEPLPAQKDQDAFALCLLLGIAYSASIGGIGTIIGTPPNLVLLSWIRETMGQSIGFIEWMVIGVPLVVIFIPLVWLMLTRVLYPIHRFHLPDSRSSIDDEYSRLGPMSRGERWVLTVFTLAVLSWVFRPLLTGIELLGLRPLAGLSDTGIALGAALLLFVIPVNLREREFVMDWQTAERMPFGILLLFGGGLSLAAAIRVNGVGEFIGYQVLFLQGIEPLLIVIAVCTLIIFLTELTSNITTTATMVPILGAVALILEVHPYLLVVTATLAASCAFMMPVATAPNAIVFSSGRITIPQMCRAGLWLNLIGIVLTTALVYWLALPWLGIAGQTP